MYELIQLINSISCSHDIMLECWRASPATRPSFLELGKRLGDMLQDSVKDVSI